MSVDERSFSGVPGTPGMSRKPGTPGMSRKQETPGMSRKQGTPKSTRKSGTPESSRKAEKNSFKDKTKKYSFRNNNTLSPKLTRLSKVTEEGLTTDIIQSPTKSEKRDDVVENENVEISMSDITIEF